MKSIKTKMMVSIATLLIFICSGLGVIAYMSASDAITNQVDDSLIELADQGAATVSERINSVFNTLESVASQKEMWKPDSSWEDKKFILDEAAKRDGHISMSYVTKNGIAKNSLSGKEMDIRDREYFKNAIAGGRAVAGPLISRDDGSLIMIYSIPIKNNGEVVGVLSAIRDGSNLIEITNEITFGKSGKAFMIDKKGVKVAHSNIDLVKKMDNDLENVKNEPNLKALAALEKLMTEGKMGAGEYEYNGVEKYLAFAPVEGTEWSLAVAAPKDEILSGLKEEQSHLLIVSIIFLIIGIVITYFMARMMALPIVKVSEHLSVIATGDFTMNVQNKFLNRKDEIGVLLRAVNKMQESIKEVIKGVINESQTVMGSVIATGKYMNELTTQIDDVSSTTEELSAGMEETAAAAEEMNASTAEIENAVETVAAKAEQGAAVVGEVSKRASEIKQNAVISKDSTKKIYISNQEKLINAIEQSKAVDQIIVLSDTILEITSKTNLLSLNAAIEAARAGEAGKGFAVVAEEIRKLAEDSKNAAKRIQETTQSVVASVENLSSSSRDVLDFIDKQVLKDYDSLVEIGEHYNKDAEIIDNIVADFSSTAQQLASSIQSMTKTINEVTSAASEGAEGATNIAGKSVIVVEKADEVLKQSNISKESSDKLIKLVEKFKI